MDNDVTKEPKTFLVQRLLELRQQAIKRGMQLLSMDEINERIDEDRRRNIFDHSHNR